MRIIIFDWMGTVISEITGPVSEVMDFAHSMYSSRVFTWHVRPL